MRKMALLLLLATSCVAEAQVNVQLSEGGNAPATPDPVEPATTNDGTLTQIEVCQIREAIAAALRQSSESWAGALVEETAGADCRLDESGTARIGLWSLAECAADCEGRPLRFLYRQAGPPVPAYAAEVVRQGEAFLCTDLGQFLVVP